MNYYFKLSKNTHACSFGEAFRSGLIKIEAHGISIEDGIKLCFSTGLFDSEDKEIFEDDIIEDTTKKKYKVLALF